LERYSGKHRDVEFVVFHSGGEWKYSVANQTLGQYRHRDHAINAVIKHIDQMLFDASSDRGRSR